MSHPIPVRRARTARLPLALLLLLFCAHAAQAAPQTFVSAKGDDANPCDGDKPCRTFAGAIIKTDVGGEIAVLDSGEYGPFHVPFSLKVTASGVYAGVTAFDSDAVTVKVNSGSVVALRGLTLTGWSSSRGIVYEGPGAAREGSPTAALHVEGCTLSGFSHEGILFKGGGNIFVKDTTVRNNAWRGIYPSSLEGQKQLATVVNCRLEKNVVGLDAGSTGALEVTVRDTVAAGNAAWGFQAAHPGARLHLTGCVSTHQKVGLMTLLGAVVMAEGCTITDNETGLWVHGSAVATIADTTIAGNKTGIDTTTDGPEPPGKAYSYGNNRVLRNGKDIDGGPVLLMQPF